MIFQPKPVFWTDLQILDEAYVELAGAPIWSAHWVRLKTGLGIVDVFATHFASSSFNLDCLGPEIAGCDEACVHGADYGACTPRQLAAQSVTLRPVSGAPVVLKAVYPLPA